MASPQLENGHTRIANELLVALASAGLSGQELSVVMFIARESFGWGSKWTKRGQTSMELTRGTMKKSGACKAIGNLMRRRIIERDKAGRWAIKKDFEAWKGSTIVKSAVHCSGRQNSTQPSTTVDWASTTVDGTVHHSGRQDLGYKVLKEMKESKESADKRRFTPPNLEQVKAYCLERGKGIDPERWLDYYTANGWRVGRNPMKDWRAAVRTWERNSNATPPPAKAAPRTEWEIAEAKMRAEQAAQGARP